MVREVKVLEGIPLHVAEAASRFAEEFWKKLAGNAPGMDTPEGEGAAKQLTVLVFCTGWKYGQNKPR